MTDAERAGARTPSAVDRIAERWVDDATALQPELAVFLGRSGFDGRYRDYSPEGLDAMAAAQRRVLAELASTPSVDAVDEVTRADLTRELELDLEHHDVGLDLADVNTVESPVQGMRDVFDLEPDATPADWERIALRLRNLPDAVAGYGATLRRGIERGVVPAVRQALLAGGQADEAAAADGFLRGLAVRGAARGDLGPALEAELAAAADGAAASYAGLADLLRDELAPSAREDDAVGRDRYALASRRFLGARIDLDETYAWGIDELARLTAEQEEVARRIAGGTVEEAIAALDADGARRLDGTDALRAWMQRLSDAAVDRLAGTEFDMPAEVRRLECRIAPTRSGVIYYTQPSDDFARPGRMWWSVPEGVTRFTTWRETTTVYHEGVPGHHLQIATALTNRDLNTWRRNAGTSGYWEGWALYAERLMAELGFLDDDADRLGMLDGQRMRAARVVVDIGLHLGLADPEGRVWTRDAALELLRRNVHMDDAFLRFEVDRYCGWPGQAASYKVGQRIWEGLRADAAARPGFDLREWHRRVLTMGGMGLDVLRGALAA